MLRREGLEEGLEEGSGEGLEEGPGRERGGVGGGELVLPRGTSTWFRYLVFLALYVQLPGKDADGHEPPRTTHSLSRQLSRLRRPGLHHPLRGPSVPKINAPALGAWVCPLTDEPLADL